MRIHRIFRHVFALVSFAEVDRREHHRHQNQRILSAVERQIDEEASRAGLASNAIKIHRVHSNLFRGVI